MCVCMCVCVNITSLQLSENMTIGINDVLVGDPPPLRQLSLVGRIWIPNGFELYTSLCILLSRITQGLCQKSWLVSKGGVAQNLLRQLVLVY
jgi:hypothetical protein